TSTQKFEPPQWLEDETPALKGLPAWLDGLDPAEDDVPVDRSTPIPVGLPAGLSHAEMQMVDPAPKTKSDSWPDLLSFSPRTPDPAGPWNEPPSWPTLEPAPPEGDDCSEVDLGQGPRRRPKSFVASADQREALSEIILGQHPSHRPHPEQDPGPSTFITRKS